MLTRLKNHARKHSHNPQTPSSSRQAAPTTSAHLARREEYRLGASIYPPDRQQLSQPDQEPERGERLHGNSKFSQTVAEPRSYRNITVGGSSRAVFGDIHAENVAFHAYHTVPPVDGPVDPLMKALDFRERTSRMASIDPAYKWTCEWIVEKPEYIRWRHPSYRVTHHGVLWIKGIPGAGKSTLMKYIYEHARDQVHRKEAVVSFFYNGRGFDIEKSTEGMYRSLLFQILEELPRLRDVLSSWIKFPVQQQQQQQQTWPTAFLENLFRTAILSLKPSEQITCYVDALDECQIDEVRQAIVKFEEIAELAMSKAKQFYICFSSRHYPHITIAHHETIKLEEQEEHQQDISKYVQNKLTIPWPLKAELATSIQQRSSGVFLWVVLVVKLLREKYDSGSTRKELLFASLEAVPDKLHDLFASILATIDSATIPALQWVLFARHPLQTSHLYFAIRTGASQLSTGFWDPREVDLERMELFIRHATRGLVEFTKYSGRFVGQFIHESVKDYLLSDGLACLDSGLQDDVIAQSHARLARCCLDYIQLDPSAHLLGDIPRRRYQYPFIKYALLNTFFHLEIAVSEQVLPLAVVDDYPIQVAVSVLHVTPEGTCGYDGKAKSLLDSTTALYLMLQDDRVILAQALLRKYPTTLKFSEHGGLSACTAPGFLDHTLVRLSINSPCGQDSGSALGSAAARGHIDIVELLLDRGADINSYGRSYGSPLVAAIQGGKESIVQLLLSRGADVDDCDSIGNNPMEEAITKGNLAILCLLLDRGADVNRTNIRKHGLGSLLGVAVGARNLEIVRLLLDHGAYVCTSQGRLRIDAGSVLGIAAGNGDLQIIKLLLDRGACVNAWTSQGPLHIAAHNTRENIVRALISYGAQVDALDEESRTPLCRIVKSSNAYATSTDETYAGVGRVLLEAGADSNATCPTYGSVVTRAYCLGWHIFARLLISYGAHLSPTTATRDISAHSWTATRGSKIDVTRTTTSSTLD